MMGGRRGRPGPCLLPASCPPRLHSSPFPELGSGPGSTLPPRWKGCAGGGEASEAWPLAPFLNFAAHPHLPAQVFLLKHFLGAERSWRRLTRLWSGADPRRGLGVPRTPSGCLLPATHASLHPRSCCTRGSPHIHPLALALTGAGPGTHGLASTISHLLLPHAHAPTAPTASLLLLSRATHVLRPCAARVAHSKRLSGKSQTLPVILRASPSSTVGGTFVSICVL